MTPPPVPRDQIASRAEDVVAEEMALFKRAQAKVGG